MVIGTATALRTNLHNFFRVPYGFEYRPVVFHGFGQGFFRIGITTRFYCFNGMQRVLKIGSADEHRIHHFGGIQFFIVVKNLDVTAQLFVNKGFSFFPAAVPDI